MGSRSVKLLTQEEINEIVEVGRHVVGGDLSLSISVVTPTSRTWVVRFYVKGKRREMGLGKLADLSVDAARLIASEVKKLVDAGVDPIQERKLATSPWGSGDYKAPKKAKAPLKKHGRKSAVSIHPKKEEIEFALANNVCQRKIAELYGVGRDALGRWKRDHMSNDRIDQLQSMAKKDKVCVDNVNPGLVALRVMELIEPMIRRAVIQAIMEENLAS